MKKEKESKLKQVMSSLDEYLSANYSIRYNLITQQCEFRLKRSRGRYRIVDEREFNSLVIEAIEQGVDCLDRDMRRYLGSSRIPSIHPVEDFLNHLPRWDGRDRVGELARAVSDEAQWVEVFHKWMLAMVAQWSGKSRMHGNCLIPVLVNPRQGLKKSTFCRSLLPPVLQDYYTDDFDVTRGGDALRKMRDLALINIDEFNRMGEAKLGRLKNLVQMSSLNMRQPYQRSYSSQPRLGSFIGTSNFRELLTDPSGSRRFYPVVTKDGIRVSRLNYGQLYAQLKEELGRNCRYWLTPAEEQAVTLRNNAFLRRPIEESLFYACFGLPKAGEKAQRWSIGQIYEVMKKANPSTMRDVKMGQFGEHLALMGVDKVVTHFGTQYLLNRI